MSGTAASPAHSGIGTVADSTSFGFQKRGNDLPLFERFWGSAWRGEVLRRTQTGNRLIPVGAVADPTRVLKDLARVPVKQAKMIAFLFERAQRA
jgi:hypothetical protein